MADMADMTELIAQCCIFCCALLLIIGFSVAGIIMTVYGSVCIHTYDYDSCGSLVGAILLIIFGILIVCCCCFSGSITYKNKETINSSVSNL